MKLILDSNILISALIKKKNSSGDLVRSPGIMLLKAALPCL